MITIFQTFYDQRPYHIPIDKALERIRSGASENAIAWVNEVKSDPKQFASRKKQLPCILFSGMFESRSIGGLVKHSGFICLDFDKFPDLDTLQMWRDTLEADEYTYCVFVSPSGMGLKCLVRIPELNRLNSPYLEHKAYFRALQAYYDCPYFDSLVFDVSRICFESYDPELQINPGSNIWTGQIFDPEPVLIAYNKASLSEQETVRRLLKWSDKKYPIVPGCRNQNLFRLACSLNDFGIPLEYALSVCSAFQCDDFKMAEIEVTLKSAYKRTGKHGSVKF